LNSDLRVSFTRQCARPDACGRVLPACEKRTHLRSIALFGAPSAEAGKSPSNPHIGFMPLTDRAGKGRNSAMKGIGNGGACA